MLVNLEIRLDLSSVFNWNVKQIFLYVTGEYSTKKEVSKKCQLASQHYYCMG